MINQYDETKDFFYKNGFYLTLKPYWLDNILSHCEIYKNILNILGMSK